MPRTVVITGASRGLGAGMAQHFLSEGLNLGLCARGESALPSSERVLTGQLDVTDAAALDQFAAQTIERFGSIELWINNAGLLEPIKALRDTDPRDVETLMRANILGVFNGSRTFVRHVRQRGGEGVLINISSGAALRPMHGWSAYCASKAAVNMLTETLALEEAETGLRAYAVAPGVIDTAMQATIRSSDTADFPDKARFVQLKANEQFSSPQWVAQHVLAAAFDETQRPSSVVWRVPPQS